MMKVRSVRKKYDVDRLKNGVVRVGWFSDMLYSDGVYVAEVAKWNEYGTYNSPARPFMRPMMHQNSRQIKEILRFNYSKAIIHNQNTTKVLNLVGMDVVGRIQKQIIAVNTPANAPITIHGGWMRNKKSGKWFYVRGKGGSKPLQDSGVMLNSVSYQVEEKFK